jgi:very-short-patch-repair endonuclease
MSTSRRYSPSSEHATIARLATAQHGVVSRAQLRHAGLTTAGIDNGVKSGRLLLVHRGVYAVGHRPASHQARAMAAVLACGPGAALSHRSAAALWQMGIRWRTPIEVSACSGHQIPGVMCHRCRAVEATREFGVPVTTPVRTLLDLAGSIDDDALVRAANEARLAGRLPPDELSELVERAPRRLQRLLAPSGAPTRSLFEDAFLRFVRRYGLPLPEVNQRVAGHEVDMLWRRERLIVELDGRAYHDEQAFERDRERDADLQAAGHRVVRVTWPRLTGAPAREAARLTTMLTTRVDLTALFAVK